MNLDDAIAAHVKWKITFRTAVNNKRAIEAPLIAHDDRCELGQWLHGDAKRRYAGIAAYSQCVEAHARFHREAGRVVDFINKGDFATAEKGARRRFAIWRSLHGRGRRDQQAQARDVNAPRAARPD